MRSSNASFNEVGFAQVIRDLEELNLNLSDLGADAEGQSQNLSVLQQSIGSLSTNIQSLLTRLNSDEQNIASLQSQVSAITPYKTASDFVSYYYNSTQTISASGSATLIWNTKISGSLTGMNTSTGVFTAPSTGVYSISANAVIGSSASANGYIITITDGSLGMSNESFPPNTFTTYLAVAGCFYLASGSTISVSFQNVGGSSCSAGGQGLSITRL